MASYTKRILISLSLLSGIVYLTGCKKAPDIYGTWTETSAREVYMQNDSTVLDVTFTNPGNSFTCTTVGTYFSSNGNNGLYILSGKTLRMTDTVSSPPESISFDVLTLTDHNLVLQLNDTFTRSPLYTAQFTYSYGE